MLELLPGTHTSVHTSCTRTHEFVHSSAGSIDLLTRSIVVLTVYGLTLSLSERSPCVPYAHTRAAHFNSRHQLQREPLEVPHIPLAAIVNSLPTKLLAAPSTAVSWALASLASFQTSQAKAQAEPNGQPVLECSNLDLGHASRAAGACQRSAARKLDTRLARR